MNVTLHTTTDFNAFGVSRETRSNETLGTLLFISRVGSYFDTRGFLTVVDSFVVFRFLMFNGWYNEEGGWPWSLRDATTIILKCGDYTSPEGG